MMSRLLFVIGTRPEAIKMAPIVHAFKAAGDFEALVCVTAQHRDMLDQVLEFFEIVPDFDLDLMRPGQDLIRLGGSALTEIGRVIEITRPQYLMVQGDTTTAVAGALAGFYADVKVLHLEAGLRSGNRNRPFPEEMNRRLISLLADIHFAPTANSLRNLQIPEVEGLKIVTGNSVIDALRDARQRVESDDTYARRYSYLETEGRMILVTAHRRENFGQPLESICQALLDVLEEHPDVHVVFPVHPNPEVRRAVDGLLRGQSRIVLLDPVAYPDMVWLLSRACIVLTDSGGLQEEAPAFGVPVLILRDVTERTEGVDAGVARIVGTARSDIVGSVRELLTDREVYSSMASATSPYGDGTTAAQVLEAVRGSVTES